jgi:hypothetical protein
MEPSSNHQSNRPTCDRLRLKSTNGEKELAIWAVRRGIPGDTLKRRLPRSLDRAFRGERVRPGSHRSRNSGASRKVAVEAPEHSRRLVPMPSAQYACELQCTVAFSRRCPFLRRSRYVQRSASPKQERLLHHLDHRSVFVAGAFAGPPEVRGTSGCVLSARVARSPQLIAYQYGSEWRMPLLRRPDQRSCFAVEPIYRVF